MAQAVLIANPAAGRSAMMHSRRADLLAQCRACGWTAHMLETGPEAGSAERLTREAVRAGARLVIACGGDGTVHEVLQGVAGTDTALGVLPFGTANALARNVQLPMEPMAALRRLLGYRAQRIPLGWAETVRGSQWFAVMAGAGPDGMLVHAADRQAQMRRAASKLRFGRAAYYGRAAHLLLTRRFAPFAVEYRCGAARQRTVAVGMMASRVPNLGGLFRGLTAQSRRDHAHLRVQLVRAPAQLSLPLWMAAAHLRLSRWNPMLVTVEAEEVRCLALPGAPAPQTQVDGEPTGELPFLLRVVPDALSLLCPVRGAR